jgi:hypothetical protein
MFGDRVSHGEAILKPCEAAFFEEISRSLPITATSRDDAVTRDAARSR